MPLKYANKKLTLEDYIEGEKVSQFRHELIEGEVYAMTGASDNHNKISGNIFSELRSALKHKNTSCSSYINDMKVKVQDNFFYPDVMVVCDQQDNENDYYKTQPIIIVEVLSESTRRTDKTLKRIAYHSIPSLQEYVLIEQDRAEIEVFTRQNGWQASYYYLEDSIIFESIAVSVQVEDIYYQVDNEDMQTFWQLKQDGDNTKDSI